MKRRTLTLIVLTLVVIVIIVTFVSPGLFIPGGPNLVRNGSFESGNFVNDPAEPIINSCNCKLLCGGSSALNDWQVARQSAANQDCNSAKDAVAWWASPNTNAIVAFDGSRAVDLTGFNSRPPAQFGRIQQSIEGLQSGAIYELSFAIGSSSRFPPPTPPGLTPFYSVTVDVAGVSNGNKSFDSGAPTPDATHWNQVSMRFTATNPSTTITFSGSGSAPKSGNGGDYIGMDNVSLRKVCWIVSAILFGCA